MPGFSTRNLVIYAVAGLLAGCAGGGGTSSGGAANPNEIVVGVAGPMSGPYAVFGEQLRKGAGAAVKDINAKGGVLGKQLRLVVGDDQCDPRKAVNVAEDFVKQHAVFVDGHFCSGSSIPASDVYSEAGVLQITPSSTNPALTDRAPDNSTVLRVCNRDDWQGKFAGAWLAKNYTGKKLAVIDDGSSYGSGVAEQTVASAAAKGMTPTVREHFTAGTKDFSSLIGEFKVQGIDVVYAGGYHPDVGLLVRQARDQGFKGDFVSDDALNTAEFWSISGPAGDGVRFSDSASMMNTPSAKQVVAQFRADGYEPEGYTLNAYAAMQAFAAAAAGAGSTDGRRMAAWLRSNHVATVIGDLRWDDKGDLNTMNFAWFVWSDGRYRQEP